MLTHPPSADSKKTIAHPSLAAPKCIDCTHAIDLQARFALCSHPQAECDLVNGRPARTCSWERGSCNSFCGPEGNGFFALSTEPAIDPAIQAQAATAHHILKRLHMDPRLASLIGPGSSTFELLTADYAAAHGLNVETLRRDAAKNMKFEALFSEHDIRCRIEEAVAKALRGAA